MIKLLRVLLGISMIISISGCWNLRESNMIDYALAVGIDMNEREEVVLTVQSPVLEALKPQAASSGEDKSKSLSVSGKTTFEAVRSYVKIMGVKVFWSHLKVMLISEKAARKGVQEYFDFFFTDPELRNTALVAVVKGRAKDILETKPDITSISANLLHNQFNQASLQAEAPTVSFNEFTYNLSHPKGGQPFLPIIKMYTQKDYDEKKVGIKSYQGKDSKQSNIFLVEGTAVFRDTKMIGALNKRETRGLLWVTNKLRSSTVLVPCMHEEKDCYITLEVSGKVHKKTSVSYDGETPVIKINLKNNLDIADLTNQYHLLDQAYLTYLEEQFAAVVRSEIEASFKKTAVDWKVDIFAFGNALNDNHPRVWNAVKDEWSQQILPEAKLDITVNAKIRRRGRILYSPWVKTGED